MLSSNLLPRAVGVAGGGPGGLDGAALLLRLGSSCSPRLITPRRPACWPELSGCGYELCPHHAEHRAADQAEHPGERLLLLAPVAVPAAHMALSRRLRCVHRAYEVAAYQRQHKWCRALRLGQGEQPPLGSPIEDRARPIRGTRRGGVGRHVVARFRGQPGGCVRAVGW